MGLQRVDLEEAGRLLGVGANAIRARAKKAPQDWNLERDNTGKIWVWIDTEKVSNDRPLKASKPRVEGFQGGSNEPSNLSDFSALKASIEALNEELKAVRAERDAYKGQVQEVHELKAERAGLLAQLDSLQKHSEQLSAEANATIADLRERLDRLTDENREALQKVLASMIAAQERADAAALEAQERRRGIFGWFGARKAKGLSTGS